MWAAAGEEEALVEGLE